MAGQDEHTEQRNGGDLARTLRAHLQAGVAAGRDPWAVAEQAGRHHGFEGAPLAWANALRWQVAHGFRLMGRDDLARATMLELTVDCEAIRDRLAGGDQ